MNIVGIIVEYNPFHNGHALHIEHAKSVANADLVVAVMSGNFLQRGEPAFVSKWSRTKMALNAGVDIVLELPYVYATQQAEAFAQGAISIINAIGANSVCFGSESGDIEEFHNLFSFLKKHEKSYNSSIQSFLKKGYSYPKALSLAFNQLNNEKKVLDLSLPNNILGYHYVKAINSQKLMINPYTIKRTTAQYHDKEITQNTIASATSIRESLIKQEKDIETIRHVVPETTFKELQSYQNAYNSFQSWEQLFPYLKYKILTTSKEQLASIYEAEEGLENRIVHQINQATNFQQFMEGFKTKRYTWTRLQRYCLHILTNTTKDEMKKVQQACPYVRVLGMSKSGRKYINHHKKEIDIPLVSTISKFNHPFIEIEKRATSCYSLGYEPIIQQKLIAEEYAQPPIIV